MTFIDRIESWSSRFLSERTYDLIVAPAIADLQYDPGAGTERYSISGYFSVLVAFAGAAYEELTADSALLKIGLLALIPALYYAFLIVLVVPEAGRFVLSHSGPLALAIGIAVLSFGPVIACCWPERTRRRPIQPEAADA
jgi:hypothetical protein